jgi:hypothetical protein
MTTLAYALQQAGVTRATLPQNRKNAEAIALHERKVWEATKAAWFGAFHVVLDRIRRYENDSGRKGFASPYRAEKLALLAALEE